MAPPGFTAPQALGPSTAATPLYSTYLGFGVDLGPGYGMWCLYTCVNGKLTGTSVSGQNLHDAMIECALACGVYYSPTLIAELMAWARSIGLIGTTGAATEGGATTGTAVAGGTGLGAGAAAASVLAILAAAAWGGWKWYLSYGAPPPVAPWGSLPKAGTPNACGGFVTGDMTIKGWGADAAHLTKTGCQVAIEEAQANALTECAKYNNLCASRSCASAQGTRCVALPVIESVTNQTHLFWCGARAHFRCACFCT